MTLSQMKAELIKMNGSFDIKDEGDQAQLVMLAALQIGQNRRKLHQFTGISASIIAKFAHNLRKSGVWKNGKVYADWFDEEEGGLAFALDTNVALGLIERAAA